MGAQGLELVVFQLLSYLLGPALEIFSPVSNPSDPLGDRLIAEALVS